MSHYSKADTIAALRRPRVGDYYTEHFHYRLWVLRVTPTCVTYLETIPPCTVPDDGVLVAETPTAFYNRFTINGRYCWVRLIGRDEDVEGWIYCHDGDGSCN